MTDLYDLYMLEKKRTQTALVLNDQQNRIDLDQDQQSEQW